MVSLLAVREIFRIINVKRIGSKDRKYSVRLMLGCYRWRLSLKSLDSEAPPKIVKSANVWSNRAVEPILDFARRYFSHLQLKTKQHFRIGILVYTGCRSFDATIQDVNMRKMAGCLGPEPKEKIKLARL